MRFALVRRGFRSGKRFCTREARSKNGWYSMRVLRSHAIGAARGRDMLDRSRLPSARWLLENEGIKVVGRPNSKDYIQGDCQFHASKSHRSCSYSLRNG